jgi:Protein of unknown function (DUF732)
MIKKLSLGAATAAAFAVLAAPLAHADLSTREQNFLRDVGAVGIATDDGQGALLSIGYAICNDLRKGYTGNAIASNLWHASISGQGLTNGITMQQAQGEVVAAEYDLCPAVVGIPA